MYYNKSVKVVYGIDIIKILVYISVYGAFGKLHCLWNDRLDTFCINAKDNLFIDIHTHIYIYINVYLYIYNSYELIDTELFYDILHRVKLERITYSTKSTIK